MKKKIKAFVNDHYNPMNKENVTIKYLFKILNKVLIYKNPFKDELKAKKFSPTATTHTGAGAGLIGKLSEKNVYEFTKQAEVLKVN